MLATVHSSYYKRCPSGAGIIPDFLMNVPLTVLSEDEQLFRDSCRSFAEERIRPLVRKMDEEAKLDDSAIPDLFQLGRWDSKFLKNLAAAQAPFSCPFLRLRRSLV